MLDQSQTNLFIDASQVDSVLFLLSQTDDDLVAAFDDSTRYSVVAQALVGAADHERNSALMLADRARCALLAVLEEQSKT